MRKFALTDAATTAYRVESKGREMTTCPQKLPHGAVRGVKTAVETVSGGVATLARSGADRARTGDPLLAKQVLSQLSYSPVTALQI